MTGRRRQGAWARLTGVPGCWGHRRTGGAAGGVAPPPCCPNLRASAAVTSMSQAIQWATDWPDWPHLPGCCRCCCRCCCSGPSQDYPWLPLWGAVGRRVSGVSATFTRRSSSRVLLFGSKFAEDLNNGNAAKIICTLPLPLSLSLFHCFTNTHLASAHTHTERTAHSETRDESDCKRMCVVAAQFPFYYFNLSTFNQLV